MPVPFFNSTTKLSPHQDNLNSTPSKQKCITNKQNKTLNGCLTSKPQSEDFEQTKLLIKALERYGVFQEQDEINRRMVVLNKLNILIAKKLGAKLFLFGSYRLGVQQSDSTIDAICVAPYNIERNYFFTAFCEFLQQQPEITECLANEECIVPFMRIVFDDVGIDLVFARLALTEIPDKLDLRDDNLLRNLDPRCIRSLDGVRVAESILTFVPNYENFRLALGTIRLWAKKRGIYSSAMGYIGGVTCAIMVARICQLNPVAAVANIVNKFFDTFLSWHWPKPIMLGRIDKNSKLQLPVWNRCRNVADREDLMPIITPAYPQKNTTCRISKSAKKTIRSELKRGLDVCNEIKLGRCSWNSIFRDSNFFSKYRYFFVLSIDSKNKADHLEWCEVIELKLHLFIGYLERHRYVCTVHANTNRFELNKAKTHKSPFRTMWFIGFGIVPKINIKNVDLTDDLKRFFNTLSRYGMKNGLGKRSYIEVRCIERRELKQYLGEDILNRKKNSLKNPANSRTKNSISKRLRV